MLILWGVLFVTGIIVALCHYLYHQIKDPGIKTFPLNKINFNNAKSSK